MEHHNLTSRSHPKAPAVIWLQDRFVSASDYGHEETRKLLATHGLHEGDIAQVMASRTLAKLGHAYKEEVMRRTGERYFDHPSGVALLLLLEFWEVDPDLLSAAMLHDIPEDVKINSGELKNLMCRTSSSEAYGLTMMVTNPEKTGDPLVDLENKKQHYRTISKDRRASVLKVADRLYNLRSLEIFHLPETELTVEHLRAAEKQLEETREFILPIAALYHLDWKILHEMERLEKRISEVSLLFTREKVKKAVEIENTRS